MPPPTCPEDRAALPQWIRFCPHDPQDAAGLVPTECLPAYDYRSRSAILTTPTASTYPVSTTGPYANKARQRQLTSLVLLP